MLMKTKVGLWPKIFENEENKKESGGNEIFQSSKWEARPDLSPTANSYRAYFSAEANLVKLLLAAINRECRGHHCTALNYSWSFLSASKWLRGILPLGKKKKKKSSSIKA